MKKIQIILLLLITVMLVSCGGNKKEVNLGLLRVPNDAMLAKQMGLFEEKYNALGYEVNYYYFDSGVDANKGIVSGDIDFATMGNINGLVALGSNLDAELVWIHETLGAVEALVVKDSANITTVEDLAGKTIATTFASTAHYVLLNVLKEAGIEDDVQLLNMKTPELVAAWNRGDIDAAYTWQPSLGLLLLDGTVLVSSEDMIAKGYMTANIELARKSFADENPELVETYIECMMEAYEYFKSHKTEAINLLSIELELTVEDITVQVDGSIWTSLAEMKNETYINGYIDTMYSQTFFLIDQDFLSRSITREEVAAFINNSYSLEVDNEKTN